MVTMVPPTVYVNGEIADARTIALPLTITHGRSSPESQPDAPSATLTWAFAALAPALGDTIQIDGYLPAPELTYDDPVAMYDDPGVTYNGLDVGDPITRFVGNVTDVVVDEVAGMPAGAAVTAVGRQADLGRVAVNLPAQPVETDVARVQAICAAAGVPITVLGSPGPNLAPAEVAGDVLSSLHTLCQSSAGLVWSGTDGQLFYGTNDHREDLPPVAAIDAYAIVSGLTWTATITELINKVTMAWATGEVTLEAPASIAEYGERWEKVSTTLDQQADAEAIGAVILARRSTPFSRITDIVLDSAYIEDDEYTVKTAMQLKVSDAVFLPIPPDPGPAGLMAEWMVEGWVESWPEPDRVTFQIAVTDRARFALTTLRDWDDADDGSWQVELDRGAWLNALITLGGAA